MKKRYYIEWETIKGRKAFKRSDSQEEAEAEMRKRIKNKNVRSVSVSWSWVGDDVPDEEIGNEYFLKGLYKDSVEFMGCEIVIQDRIKETQA